MNQILETRKIYVTPELKKKKRFYKYYFIASVFLVCILFSCYIYAEYDKNKSEEVSKQLLASIEFEQQELEDTQTADDVILIVLDSIDQLYDNTIISTEAVEAAEAEEADSTQSKNDYDTIAVINIPKIGVNYPILSKTTDELLKISPTKFWGPNPNEVGNFCITGHNYRNNKFFSKVPTLVNGDIIELTDMTGRMIQYKVYSQYIVEPTDIECTSQLTNGKREVTLITCTNDNKRRIITKAVEI